MNKREFDPNIWDYGYYYDNFQWYVPKYHNFAWNVINGWSSEHDKIALILVNPNGWTARRLTFSELRTDSNQVANALALKGIGKGDRVLLMVQSEEFYISLLAAMKLGIIVIPLKPTASKEDIELVIKECRPVMVIAGRETAKEFDDIEKRFEGNCHKIIINGIKDGWESWEELTSQASPILSMNEVEPTLTDEPMLLSVLDENGNGSRIGIHIFAYPFAQRIAALCVQDVKANDVVWTVEGDGSHFAFLSEIFGQWFLGATVLQWNHNQEPSATDMVKIISNFGITILSASSETYRKIIADCDLERYDLAKLRHLTSYGRSPGKRVFKNWKEITGLNIYSCFHDTHSIPFLANYICKSRDGGSLGFPTPGYHIEIVDDRGEVLPTGNVGNIAVRMGPQHPPGVVRGYLESNTCRRVESLGGWYLTGKKGCKDKAGRFWSIDGSREFTGQTSRDPKLKLKEEELYLYLKATQKLAVDVAEKWRQDHLLNST